MDALTIRQFASSFQTSRILLSGVELDLFTHIDGSGVTSDQLAKNLDLDSHACDRLLNALVSLGFLAKKDQQFFNTEDSFNFLSRKSPNYLGGLMHSNHLWNTWSHLTEVVKTGASAYPAEINDRGEEWLVSFISAMHDRAIKQAPQQLADLDLTGVNYLLDIGGGSGAYSMEFIRQKPGLEATVFDLPNVVPITNQFIEKEGFSGKIETYTGDYTKDELPHGFDLVFLSAIIHSNPLETNQQLVKKCFDALNKGGKIIIQDWIMNNDRTQPTTGAIFAINMLVGTDGGDCFTEQEVTEMFDAAGFKNSLRIELGSGLSQMIAQKI